ncbi:hypothetical protein EXE30_00315 [Acinetobacter halotolerans]|uniref:Uncharacterized protein n=1 Tax=Acinetobacter halotolerans TaxID=1752076 RepID=A0A4Q6XCF1_9GAMM|nr:hypothetical protein [Acinetobacter halotolerans]RZF56738.1 hypothetical protein EXE30_00315 [Acinetobacter halotolerans]
MRKDTKELLLTALKTIVASNEFRESLLEINENFFNLKQESHIRNVLLIHINNFFKEKILNYKAISEHPRINNTRIDLSIVNLDSLDDIFKIEFKFQLIGDYKRGNIIYRKNEIAYDFNNKKSDLFILIVIEWDDSEKLKFDKACGLEKSLINFNKGNTNHWRDAINLLFSDVHTSELYEHERIEIYKPYKTLYHFYFLSQRCEKQSNVPYDKLFKLLPFLEKVQELQLTEYELLINQFINAMDKHMCSNYDEILADVNTSAEQLQNLTEKQLLAFLTAAILRDRFIDWYLKDFIKSGTLLLALKELQYKAN